MYRWLLWVCIMLFFAGCGPRYVIKNQYIPPASSLSQPCLNNCSLIRQGCQDQCQRNYQYCLDDAYGKAKAVEMDEQRAYEMAYSRYQMDAMRFVDGVSALAEGLLRLQSRFEPFFKKKCRTK